MTGERAEVEALAISELGSNLRAYVHQMEQGIATVHQHLAVAESIAQQSVNAARRDVSTSMEHLSACLRQEDSECRWQAQEVERASKRLEEMYGIARQIESLTAGYRPATRRFESALSILSHQAQRELRRAGETVDIYLRTTATPGTTASAGKGPAPANEISRREITHPKGFPDDIVMVPLDMIDDSDSRIHKVSDFSKSYTPADLEWAHERFVSVVMPGVANGATIDDFRERDRREGRMGTRSYEMTYSGFFGADAINLSSNGSTLEVNNGYHRIWVAKRMGIQTIPARVSGHDIS